MFKELLNINKAFKSKLFTLHYIRRNPCVLGSSYDILPMFCWIFFHGNAKVIWGIFPNLQKFLINLNSFSFGSCLQYDWDGNCFYSVLLIKYLHFSQALVYWFIRVIIIKIILGISASTKAGSGCYYFNSTKNLR